MARDTVQTKRRATYEDLLRVPDTMVAEIVDGELVVSPRPASPHAYAATEIAADLVPAFHGVEARSGSHARDEVGRVEPFAALEIRLGRWWLAA